MSFGPLTRFPRALAMGKIKKADECRKLNDAVTM
jgi:hypothetical protein